MILDRKGGMRELKGVKETKSQGERERESLPRRCCCCCCCCCFATKRARKREGRREGEMGGKGKMRNERAERGVEHGRRTESKTYVVIIVLPLPIVVILPLRREEEKRGGEEGREGGRVRGDIVMKVRREGRNRERDLRCCCRCYFAIAHCCYFATARCCWPTFCPGENWQGGRAGVWGEIEEGGREGGEQGRKRWWARKEGRDSDTYIVVLVPQSPPRKLSKAEGREGGREERRRDEKL